MFSLPYVGVWRRQVALISEILSAVNTSSALRESLLLCLPRSGNGRGTISCVEVAGLRS